MDVIFYEPAATYYRADFSPWRPRDFGICVREVRIQLRLLQQSHERESQIDKWARGALIVDGAERGKVLEEQSL